jgi:FkbM family methyltransferase
VHHKLKTGSARLDAFDRQMRLLVRTIRLVGFRKGLSAYWAYVSHRIIASRREMLTRLDIPGIAHPVWLRPGTSDWSVMEQIFLHDDYGFSSWPQHESAIYAHYQRILQQTKIPIIIDCGANIGLSAIWFAMKFPRARVFAIEPEPGNFEVLSRNVAPFENVVPVQAGISDRCTRASLVNVNNEPWAWQIQENGSGEIATVTIPTLFRRCPDGEPLIVKFDIEGSEVELFRSDVAWVERTPLIVFELHDHLGGWQGTGHAVFTRLSTHPRDYMQRGENMFSFAHSLNEAKSMDPAVRTSASLYPVAADTRSHHQASVRHQAC